MYGFTHILCVSFADGSIVLFYVSCTFSVIEDLYIYFLLTESWYESTGIYEPIDELYI